MILLRQMAFDGKTVMIGSFLKLKNAEKLNVGGHTYLGIPAFAQVYRIIKTRKFYHKYYSGLESLKLVPNVLIFGSQEVSKFNK